MLILSPLYSDNMVIQHGVAFPVRGRSSPGAKVSVKMVPGAILGAVLADESGAWQLALEPVPAGGPYSMEITSDGEKITLNNIYSGDVWLAAGQSNMEMLMQRLKDDYPEEWQELTTPAPDSRLLTPDSHLPIPIHQFKVVHEWDFSGPRKEFSGGSWIPVSAETLNEFSGTAWFFAKKMYETHRIPIGIINNAWGGTPVEAWMSREALAPYPAKLALASMYADRALCDDISRTSTAHLAEWKNMLDRQDRGIAAAWHTPETSLSDWEDISLPGSFADAGISGFNGIIWLCRDIDLGGEYSGRDAKIWLGTIVDADTVYINGTEVGNVTYRYPPRKYDIPAGLLRSGKNRIAVRVTCASGEGGITMDKPFRIFSDTCSVDLAGIWKYRIGVSAYSRPLEFNLQRQPCGLYNAMTAPLIGFPLKGVIWYQGESNERNASEYARLFIAMIQDLRVKTNQPELPFIFVQLPIYGNPTDNRETASWARIREAQAEALALPHTGMAAALELGEWNDLHPFNKKDVGYRLALAAEKVVYNAANTSPGPMIRCIEKNKQRLVIRFNNCGAGLVCSEQPHVSLICAKGQLRLPAVIENASASGRAAESSGADSISIDISSVENPIKVLYAWADNPRDRQLFNSDGLLMLPFKVLL